MQFSSVFPPDIASLTVDSELVDVVRAMARPSSGLKVCNRSWLKITIPNAFIGKKNLLTNLKYYRLNPVCNRGQSHKTMCCKAWKSCIKLVL